MKFNKILDNINFQTNNIITQNDNVSQKICEKIILLTNNQNNIIYKFFNSDIRKLFISIQNYTNKNLDINNENAIEWQYNKLNIDSNIQIINKNKIMLFLIFPNIIDFIIYLEKFIDILKSKDFIVNYNIILDKLLLICLTIDEFLFYLIYFLKNDIIKIFNNKKKNIFYICKFFWKINKLILFNNDNLIIQNVFFLMRNIYIKMEE